MALRTPAARVDDGASAVEYALLVVAIAAVITAVVFGLGIVTKGNIGRACTAWDSAASTAGSC